MKTYDSTRLPVRWEAKASALGRAVAETDVEDLVVSLWPSSRISLSYWALFVSGINRPDEVKIAQEVLTWNAFLSKEVAQLYCAQSSEVFVFDMFYKRFGLKDMPSLLVSIEPSMKNVLVISSDMLRYLSRNEGDIQQFLARTQMLLTAGGTLKEVAGELRKESFWRWIRAGWSELKSVVSISISSAQDAG
jgi:hypothetical protein